MSTLSQLHDAARSYASAGLKIFPIAPGRKDPPLTARGIYDASSDLAQVDAWWRQTPDANVGLFCQGSGIHVLDIDTRFGNAVLPYLRHLESMYGKLPSNAAISRTRSGGFHAIFDARGAPPDWSLKEDPLYHRAWLLPGSDGKKHKVLELKCVGYIVLPPSYIDAATENDGIGGGYEWRRAPSAPAPLLPSGWYQGLRREAPIAPRLLPRATAPNHAKLQGLVDHVFAQAGGNRDAALFWASNRALDEIAAGYYSAAEAYGALYDAGLAIGQQHWECRRALRKLRRLLGGGGR